MSFFSKAPRITSVEAEVLTAASPCQRAVDIAMKGIVHGCSYGAQQNGFCSCFTPSCPGFDSWCSRLLLYSMFRFIDGALPRKWTVQSLIVDRTHLVLVSGELVFQKNLFESCQNCYFSWELSKVSGFRVAKRFRLNIVETNPQLFQTRRRR